MRRTLQFAALLVFVLYAVSTVAEINVLDFGAVPNGKSDCTAAFQKALDQAAVKGEKVIAPAGQYRFDGVLNIPDDVTLEGVWEGYHFARIDKGTALLTYAGRDNEDGAPFIALQSNSTVKGVSIAYPEQDAKNIRPYPWTIQMHADDGSGRGSVIDVAIANAYNAIDCGSYRNGGAYIRNIHMTALRRGVYIDRSGDIGRFENIQLVHMGWGFIGGDLKPDSEGYKSFVSFMMENLEGYIIGRCDWTYMVDCFVLRPKVGFHFIHGALRADEKTKGIDEPNILITQSGSDMSPLAVHVEYLQDHAGVAFSNCQFMNGVIIEETNTGPLKFNNCGFWGETNTGDLGGTVIRNHGSGEVVMTACHFSTWEDPRRTDVVWNPTAPLLDFYNGSLLLNGCVFKDYENNPVAHVKLRNGTRAAVIMGNIVKNGEMRLVNDSRGDVQVFGNVSQ